MASAVTRFFGRVRGRLERLPLAALLAIGGLVVIGTTAGGYYAYQGYDYVEHDNEFCFSCHLMQEPYELFAQSAHRGLGCKACHQPNLLQRSEMGLTAIVLDPDSVGEHAAVPNDLCADCHINGDPDTWILVAQSAGHRVHLESDDPSLSGLQCVECHASSLHEFAAADKTCAQSDCHVDSAIQLGAMSDLTIHCAACHGFSAPVADVADASDALAPDESTCFSCHAMRTLAAMPDPDPHQGECASCHNPHEQTTPTEAVQTCSSAQCHSDVTSLTPFHTGLESGVVEGCLYCHQAHDFAVDGSNCVACHSEVMRDEPAAVRPAAAQLPAAPSSAAQPGAGVMHSWNGPLPQTLDFRHSQHAGVDCASCHESSTSHGRVTVTTITDCRTCHHAEERIAADGCASCHETAGSGGDPFSVTRTLRLSTGASPRRAMTFDHQPHETLDCASCHTEGLALSAAAVDCASCHDEHHEPETLCVSCHAPAPAGAHAVATAHVTCSGAGCHTEVPFEGVPRTNSVCLVCHQDQADHRPGGECAECHALPGGEDGQ